MSFYVQVERGRKATWTVSLYEADGTTEVALAADDVVRFKIARRSGATPQLDLNSTTHTSRISFTPGTNAVTLTLYPSDTTDLSPGVWDAEVAVVDSSIMTAELGTVAVLGTPGGSV